MPWVKKHELVICPVCRGTKGWPERGGVTGRQTIWITCETCMGMGRWHIPYWEWVSRQEFLEMLQNGYQEEDNE